MRNTEAELKHRFALDQTLFDQLMGEHDVTGFEYLEFGFNPEFRNASSHDTQVGGLVNKYGFAKIEPANIERADVWAQFLDVLEPVEGLNQRCTGPPDRGIDFAGAEPRTLAGGQVYQYVDVRITNTFNHFAKQGRFA